jgi:hypothetical protein
MSIGDMVEAKTSSDMKSTVSNMVSRLRGNNNIINQLLGIVPIDEFQITTFEEYDDIFRTRHDIVHAIICNCLDLDFGEKTIDSLLPDKYSNLRTKPYWENIKMQTPDYFKISGKRIFMVEISVSLSDKQKDNKFSKYALLMYFFKKYDFHINYKIIIINPRRVYMNRDELISQHGLNDPSLQLIKVVCDNFNELHQKILYTRSGEDFFRQRHSQMESDIFIDMSIDDVVRDYEAFENKPFHTDSCFDHILKGKPPSITQRNNDINSMMDMCINKMISSPLSTNESFTSMDYIEKINRLSTTKDPRHVFPLPYVCSISSDAMDRSTESDKIEMMRICEKMRLCQNDMLSSIGSGFSKQLADQRSFDPKTFKLCKLSMSSDVRYSIALEGPGRKHYVKKGSQEHIAEQTKNKSLSLHFDTDISRTEEVIRFMSLRDDIPDSPFMENCSNYTNLKGFGLNYVKTVQSIFREININCLRKDRRKMFCLSPTSIKGVFILIHPGAKLRCGEMPSQIWFKVIIENNEYEMPPTDFPSELFQNTNISGELRHSRWLSVDANRLDHYLRCYDKVLMAYYAYISQSFRSTNEYGMATAIRNDDSDVLGLIITIYLEDRRCTSKLLQSVRYLGMTSLSLFKFYNSVMEKTIEPVRSPVQLLMLKRMLGYIEIVSKIKIYEDFKVGQIRYDVKTKTFISSKGGVVLKVPRIITTSITRPKISFEEMLSEMYFCMLFNKNQDDPTHSSFQILTKMLEGESKFNTTKGLQEHLGYNLEMNDIEWASNCIDQPRFGKFSRKAIQVGMSLYLRRIDDLTGDKLNIAARNPNINKTLDEFATYKSSANLDNWFHNGEPERQNTRRRCISGVMELLNEGLSRSFDVIKQKKDHKTSFQVFKKNQIGGVREILILPIVSRIVINTLETFSRNVCKLDSREMMTHGATKQDAMKHCLFQMKQLKGKRMTIFYNFDKSKWGPRFVPIQFLYMFNEYKDKLGPMFNLILSILIKHHNKSCILPERLVLAWFKDPQNKLKHTMDENLQKMKEDFLKKRNLSFINESNMGQGILHYTSSLYHLVAIEFRNELYKRICIKLNWEHNDLEDLVSSDDSITFQSLEISKIKKSLDKIKLLLRCQEITERLFNIETSRSKSCISPLIGEFNSLFMSNATFFPTTIKFAISSVHPVNTDSFFRMVKESYSASRQLVENGGSLELYMIASMMNKRYCESMYHTNEGGQNDFKKFGITKIPYHMGEYPIFHPSLMVMFGPEFHNYKLYHEMDDMNHQEKKLFIGSHKILKGDFIESICDIENGDTSLGGLMRVEAMMGPITQLERLRKQSILTTDQIKEKVIDDPLILLRRPSTLDEIIWKTCKKLYLSGSKEAMKSITHSIYFGRMSASVSANCFYIPSNKNPTPNEINDTDDPRYHDYRGLTYENCIKKILDEPEIKRFDEHIKFLYPKWVDYENYLHISAHIVPSHPRNLLESRSVCKLATHKINTNLYFPTLKIIQYLWNNEIIPPNDEAKMLRDVTILMKFFPLIKPTHIETMNQFPGDKDQKTKSLLTLLMKLFSLRNRNMKGILFGNSTNDIQSSYDVLSRFNAYSDYTSDLVMDPIKLITQETYNDIFLAHNIHIMRILNKSKTTIWDQIDDDMITMFLLDPAFNRNIKKRILMCLLDSNQIIDLAEWTRKTNLIIHCWKKKQRFNYGKYTGPYDLVLMKGNKKMEFISTGGTSGSLTIIKSENLHDPKEIMDFLEEWMSIFETTVDDLLNESHEGKWIIQDDKVLKSDRGFNILDGVIDASIMDEEFTLISDGKHNRLVDSCGRTVYSQRTGLLAINGTTTLNYQDFTFHQVKLSRIMELGAMRANYSVMASSRKKICDCLDDLFIEEPEIFETTRDRLGLSMDWLIKKHNDDEKEILTISRASDTISRLMDVDQKDLKEAFENFDDPTEQFLVDLAKNEDLISTLTTNVEFFNMREILDTLINLKYNMIVRMLTQDITQINREMMGMCYSYFKQRPLQLSLISVYDQNSLKPGDLSPSGATLSVFGPFIEKFNLQNSSSRIV